MNPTDNTVAQATKNLDDNLNPLEVTSEETKTEQPKEDVKPSEEVKKEEVTSEESKTDETEGYTADEIGSDEAVSQPAEERKPTNLSPESQFIYDNLPEIVTVGNDGKQYRVKTDGELPADFDFQDKATERAFYRNLSAQELNARDLQKTYKNNEQQTNAQDFERKENEAIKSDIAQLQKDGLIPKYKALPDSADFDKDPAVVQSQEVLEFMNKKNNDYLSAYNAGGLYKHIGFEEAYYMMQATKPKVDTKKDAQDAEDKERLDIAKKVGGSQGLSSGDNKVPTVRPGTSTRELLDRIDNMEI